MASPRKGGSFLKRMFPSLTPSGGGSPTLTKFSSGEEGWDSLEGVAAAIDAAASEEEDLSCPTYKSINIGNVNSSAKKSHDKEQSVPISHGSCDDETSGQEDEAVAAAATAAAAAAAAAMFFDSSQKKMVEIRNFSFPDNLQEDDNGEQVFKEEGSANIYGQNIILQNSNLGGFESTDESSLALLDPSCLEGVGGGKAGSDFDLFSIHSDRMNTSFTSDTDGQHPNKRTPPIPKKLLKCAQTASRGASGIETGAPIKKDNHPSESKTDPKEKRQHIQPGKSITNAPSQLQAKNLQKQKSLNKRRINQGDVSGNSFESSGSGHHQNIANCVGRKPKILSPKDSKNSSFSSEADSSASTAVTRQHHQTAANVRRKLSSGDDGSPAVTLPSRKGPSSANQSTPVKNSPAKDPQNEPTETKIPVRFNKKNDGSSKSKGGQGGQKGKSPVQRKISVKKSPPQQQSQQQPVVPNFPTKLGRTKSHSASNLSKISVIDYHNMQPTGNIYSSSNSVAGSERKKDRKDVRSSSWGSISCGNLFSRVDKYAHVESKVKKYIEDIKTSEIQHKEELLAAQGFDLSASRNCVDNDDDVLASMGLEARTAIPGSPGGPRKSLSMSNLVMMENNDAADTTFSSNSSAKKSKMKAFLSSRNLDDLQISIRSRSKNRLQRGASSMSMSRIGRSASNLSRLLDRLSSEEEERDHGLAEYDLDRTNGTGGGGMDETDDVCIYPVRGEPNGAQEEDVLFEVEDLLTLAIEERRGKQEAKHVLSQLQESYDTLQRKYAQAEIVIDKYRFGSGKGDVHDNEGGQAAICATPGVGVSTTEKAMAVPGDFGHFLKPGPFLTSEEADNMDGIGTIRIRLEEVQDQVCAMELLTSSSECDLTPSEKEALFSELSSAIHSLREQVTEQFGANSLSRLEVSEIIEAILVLETKIQALYRQTQQPHYSPAPLPALAAPSEIGFKHNFPAVTADFDSGCCCLGSDRSCGTTKSSCSHYQAAGSSSGGGHRGKAVQYNQRDQLRLSNVEEEARTNHQKSPRKVHPATAAGSSSSLPSDYLPKKKSTSTAGGASLDRSSARKRHQRVAAALQQSLTDLSSDERVKMAKAALGLEKVSSELIERELERMMTSASSREVTPRKSTTGGGQNVDNDRSGNSLRLKPPTPPSTQRSPYTPGSGGGSTMILAQQIDQEISELRSVFEGHREEMLSLLETAPPAPNSSVPRNPLEPFNVTLLPDDSPSKTLQTTMSLPRNFNSARDPEGPTPRGNAETEEDTDSGVTKVRIDRKREFEKRRQSIQNRRKKVHLNQRACQSVERASPSKAAPSASRQSLPNFDVGGVTSSPKAAAVGSNTISQFFPLKNGASTNGVAGGGRVLSTAGGDQVFIPNLNLEWSECSGGGELLNPGRSHPGEHPQESLGESFEQTKRKWKSVSSVGTQVDPPNLSIVKASNLTLAKSMVEIARATDVSCQTEREGRDNQATPTDEAWCQTDPDEVSGKALENDERATAIKLTQLIERDPRLAASLGSHLDKHGGVSSGSTTIVLNDCCGSGHRGVTPISDNNQTDKAKSLSRRNQSKKNKKELRELLTSLNAANEMASRLKQRSEDILTTLKGEMVRFQQQQQSPQQITGAF